MVVIFRKAARFRLVAAQLAAIAVRGDVCGAGGFAAGAALPGGFSHRFAFFVIAGT
jgi:hypothetical protein